jgi:hypothetical protein
VTVSHAVLTGGGVTGPAGVDPLGTGGVTGGVPFDAVAPGDVGSGVPGGIGPSTGAPGIPSVVTGAVPVAPGGITDDAGSVPPIVDSWHAVRRASPHNSFRLVKLMGIGIAVLRSLNVASE